MEDVDAASEIVHRRDTDPANGRTTKTTVEVSRPDPTGSGGVVTEKFPREVSSTGNEQSAAVRPRLAQSERQLADHRCQAPTGAGDRRGGDDEQSGVQDAREVDEGERGEEEHASHGRIAAPGGGGKDDLLSKMTKLLSDGDELNLAGLLNVLDGVVDTPDRVLVRPRPSP